MKVSFVIPSLNQGGFIRRCIESCYSQGLEDYEVIVRDGGSTDQTTSILRAYGDRVDWISQRDRGQSDAINQGILRGKGEIIAWINSDDYYPQPNVLGPIVSQFINNFDLDIVYGDALYVDVEGRPLRYYGSRQFVDFRQEFIRNPVSPVAQPAVFFRRDLFLNCGGIDEKLHYAMDHELWCRMFSKARAWKYVPEVLAHQTLHDDAKSVRSVKKQIAEVYQIKSAFLRNNRGTTQEWAWLKYGWLSMHFYRIAYQLGLPQMIWKTTGLQRRTSPTVE